MKRLFTLYLTLAMLLTFLFPANVFAEENKELESAITRSKLVLDIGDGYDTFNYNINKHDNLTVYNLRWNDSKNKLGEVNVTIDSTGRITGYYAYNPQDSSTGRPKFPAISKADALKTANEFILKVNPSVKDKIKYQENNTMLNVNEPNYYFNYIRVENGIPCPFNFMNVSIDNRTGKIQNYSCSWTDELLFPDSKDIISMEKAQQAFSEKLGLKPVYRLSGTRDEQKVYLAYVYLLNNKYIDAKTGEIISGGAYPYPYENAKGAADKNASNSMDSQAKVALSPQEKEALENASNFINEKKAEEIARKTLNLDNTYRISNINLYSSWRNKSDYIWNMQFNKEDKNTDKPYYYYAGISIDAKTGEVADFSRSIPYDQNAAVKYDKEQSMAIAKDFIKSMQSGKFDEIEYVNWNEPVIKYGDDLEKPRQYYFTFTRKTNGVYFPGDGFNIGVDATSGTIINYGFTWFKGDLPSTSEMISSDDAHKAMFDNVGLELQYLPDYSQEVTKKIIPPPDRQVKPAMKIVYTIKPGKPVIIDALTGRLLDYSGKPYTEKVIPKYSDIEGNAAENEIRTLSQYGIFLPGDEFSPDNNIYQKDYLYLLSKAMNFYIDNGLNTGKNPDDALYSYLISSGIVKEGEQQHDAAVTRQDAVKFIIRALKYDHIADIKGIYTLPFEDADSIDSNLYGYVALAYGLGVVKDDNGYFKPADSLTRGQAAILIYNLLNSNF